MLNPHVFRQLSTWRRGSDHKATGRRRRHSALHATLRLEPLEERRLLTALTIAQENLLPGTSPNVWDVGYGSANIEGYATQMSVNHGETVQFKINTDSNNYRIDIYRTGYYGGLGARFITTINSTASLAHNQPNAVETASTGLVDAGNWHVSAQWAVPSDATSGVYIANLIRQDGVAGESQIIFIVRADESHSDMVFKTADATWEAYNLWGGNDLYGGDGIDHSTDGRAYAVSYNRPFDYDVRSYNLVSFYFGEDFPMVRFLEENGYDVSYIANKDLDEHASLLMNHKIFATAGHDEYWSAAERAAVTTARDAGVSLGFFGGNDVFWKTYTGPSSFDPSTPDRTIICYKDTHANAIIDPVNPNVWTGTWRDPRFSPPTDGGQPENALTGTMFTVNSDGVSRPITVPAADGALRFWRNTSVASLAANQSAQISDHALGEETDSDVDNGFRPAGLIDLSHTTFATDALLLDYGSTYGAGTATHSLTMYRAASGALVFSAGSQQYSWGLDGDHDGQNTQVDSRLQQATVNLFADMGAQPGTLLAGLVLATMSTDHLAPTSTITSPLQGALLQSGVAVTIRGTAQDSGGGIVAGVEVSVDGGLTWHPATGRASWTYTWTPPTNGTVTIKSRAVDDSGNLEQASAGITINPGTPGATTFSLWNSTATPTVADSGDAQALELGTKFTADTSGTITGVRFYKSAANTGTHTASLWSASGQLLATATFTGETASGWQQANFATPLAITAGTTYVASYHTTSGHYSVTQSYFTSTVSSGPLHVPANGGVYLYGASAFPTGTYQGSNYWVDVVLNTAPTTSPPADTTPPTVTAMSPANGASGAATNAAATITFSEALSAAAVTSSTVFLRNASNVVITSTVAYNSANNTVTLTPSAALGNSTTYTIVVKSGTAGVKDVAGNALATDATSSFTTIAATPPADTTPPTVTAVSPANGSASATTNSTVAVTFSEALSAASVTSSTIFLRDASNTAITSTVAYNSANNTVTLTPSAALADSTTYTVVVKSGTAGVKDAAGNALAVDFTSSFTTVTSIPVPSPTPAPANYSLWTSTATPSMVDSADTQAVELGTKFTSDSSGTITGLRFYKAAANTGTHTASLWNSTGQLLATATFTGETASGWQQANFATPVTITAGTTYVASYHTSSGHYSVSRPYFSSAFTSGPLHVPANGGVYLYGNSAFPTGTYQGSNYWVDVVLSTTATTTPPADTTRPTVTAVTPSNGATGTATGAAATITFSEALSAASVTSSTIFLRNASNTVITASVAYNATNHTVTLTPSSALANSTTYTVVVKSGTAGIKDAAGNALAADFTSSFTTVALAPAPAPTATASLFAASVTPAIVDSRDTAAVELGVKFTSDKNGTISGVRFYKSAGNTGTHTGSLWTASGQLIATGTFTGETASGWQTLTFAAPVAITAGTTYVASYHTASGHYSVTQSYFNAAFTAGSLHVAANGGVYSYGAGGFPNSSYQGSNYWIDVLFNPAS